MGYVHKYQLENNKERKKKKRRKEVGKGARTKSVRAEKPSVAIAQPMNS